MWRQWVQETRYFAQTRLQGIWRWRNGAYAWTGLCLLWNTAGFSTDRAEANQQNAKPTGKSFEPNRIESYKCGLACVPAIGRETESEQEPHIPTHIHTKRERGTACERKKDKLDEMGAIENSSAPIHETSGDKNISKRNCRCSNVLAWLRYCIQCVSLAVRAHTLSQRGRERVEKVSALKDRKYKMTITIMKHQIKDPTNYDNNKNSISNQKIHNKKTNKRRKKQEKKSGNKTLHKNSLT